MNFLFACLVAFSLMLVGCAKNDDSKKSGQTVEPKNQTPVAIDLSGKTVEEVLSLKYSKALLSCALWSQRSKEIDLTVVPNDSATLDLKVDTSMPKNLKLHSQIENQHMEVDLNVSQLAIYGSLHLTDSSGNVFIAKYSPYVSVGYSHKSTIIFGVGQSMTGSVSDIRTVNEKIIDTALNESISSQPEDLGNGVVIDRGAFNNVVSCTIETEIKPEYQDQFQMIPAKN